MDKIIYRSAFDGITEQITNALDRYKVNYTVTTDETKPIFEKVLTITPKNQMQADGVNFIICGFNALARGRN